MIETRNYQLPAGSAADPRFGETFQRGVVKVRPCDSNAAPALSFLLGACHKPKSGR